MILLQRQWYIIFCTLNTVYILHTDFKRNILLKVNELCMELLASYPAAEFVRVTLTALSTLASATLIDVPQQVALLLRYLQDDPRLSVKRHALHLLHSLARRGAHLWPQGALNNLIGI